MATLVRWGLFLCLFPLVSGWVSPRMTSGRRVGTIRHAQGLYRPFVDLVWDRLEATCWFEAVPLAPEDSSNSAPAKGMENGVVNMEIRALQGKHETVAYARAALLETIRGDSSNNTAGIQVMNLVIFPNVKSTNLPVWGADFVSLPGNKHLLLLDAQPMCTDSPSDFALNSSLLGYKRHH